MEQGTTENFLSQKLHVVPGPFPGTPVEAWGSVTPRAATLWLLSCMGQHHLQPHGPSNPMAIARAIHSPSLFFSKTKLSGIQPCSIQLIGKSDLGSLFSPPLSPQTLSALCCSTPCFTFIKKQYRKYMQKRANSRRRRREGRHYLHRQGTPQ